MKTPQQAPGPVVYWWRSTKDQIMTTTINLPETKLEELRAEAKATGKDVETVVRDAVDARLARRKRTFADVLKPIHDAIEASGMNEEQVTELFDKALKDIRAERP